MESPQVIGSKISEYIYSLPSKKISGTELSQFLKFSFRGFSPFTYGYPKLRLFLRQYVPDVVAVGRAGGDVVYGIQTPNQVQPAETAHISSTAAPSGAVDKPALIMSRELWKSYASPNSLWHIYANRESGEFQVTPPGHAGPPDPWVLIPPCSAEVHIQIAKNYVSALADTRHQELLQKTLGQPRWWDSFYAATTQIGLSYNWQSYRRREIFRNFMESLTRSGIPIKHRPSIHSAPSTANREQLLARSSGVSKPDEDERLRRAVVSAVERMSVSELRALTIPVGYLLDELRRDG